MSLLWLISSCTSPISLERAPTISNRSCRSGQTEVREPHSGTAAPNNQLGSPLSLAGANPSGWWTTPAYLSEYKSHAVSIQRRRVGARHCHLLTSIASWTASCRSNWAGFSFWKAWVLQIWTKILKSIKQTNKQTLMASYMFSLMCRQLYHARNPRVPEQGVQFGGRTGSRGEDVSVLGHQTQTVLQETVEGIPKFLFLLTKCSTSINTHVSHGRHICFLTYFGKRNQVNWAWMINQQNKQ